MSRPMLRLPRLGCSTLGLTSPSTTNAPVRRRPLWGSPVTACSTLSTSAPQSASTAPAEVTKPHIATSTTRTPASGWCMSARREGDGLELQVLGQAGDAHLAADARLLVAAE